MNNLRRLLATTSLSVGGLLVAAPAMAQATTTTRTTATEATALVQADATPQDPSSTATDQAAPVGDGTKLSPGSPSDGDIVVTARRRGENLQSVPVSVQAVTSDQIAKLALTNVTDVARLAPGLSLSNDTGTNPVIVLRGVRWTNASGTPAIPIYLNESSFNPSSVLQTMYDIGQIEVLRGPQGTARGAPSISGAVTLTTHRPDLNSFGGYAYGLLGTRDHQNVQAAVNIPVIDDKLAIRVAGVYENTRANDVRSDNNGADPFYRTLSGRVSIRFEPTDTFKLNVMYQHLDTVVQQYEQVAGPGSSGFTVDPVIPSAPSLILPANFNSRSLQDDDYRSVQTMPLHDRQISNLVVVNAGLDILGQRLSYNFGYEHAVQRNITSTNEVNIPIGYDARSTNSTLGTPVYMNQEIRLSSIPAPGRFFDYDVGFYYNHQDSRTGLIRDGAFLPGAFGAPLVAPSNPYTSAATIARYTLPISLIQTLENKDYSFYGNVNLHLPAQIELTGGVRWNHVERYSRTQVDTLGSTVSLPTFLPATLGGCPTNAPISAVYGAGFCDVAIQAAANSDDRYNKTITPTIYNVSLSRRFSPNFLIYATVGSSYRAGVANIFNPGLPPQYGFTDPEKATSYEVGIKTTLAERRIRFNADIFQIDYDGQLTQYAGIPYYNSISGTIGQTSGAFFRNNNARVRGVEVELGLNLIKHFSLDSNVSYAKIVSRGGLAPCSDPSRPITATNIINFCPINKGDTLNASPTFQASANGAYTVPLGRMDGYLRFIVNYQGRNPNFGASDFATRAYTLIDLFAGLTGDRGGWDIGLYAKNVLNVTRTLTSRVAVPAVSDFGPSGLSLITTNFPREVGVTARFAFGTR